MSIVTSKDGTTIAFDAWGEGQPLIMIDGATSHRAVNPTNAEVGSCCARSSGSTPTTVAAAARAPTPHPKRCSARSRTLPP